MAFHLIRAMIGHYAYPRGDSALHDERAMLEKLIINRSFFDDGRRAFRLSQWRLWRANLMTCSYA